MNYINPFVSGVKTAGRAVKGSVKGVVHNIKRKDVKGAAKVVTSLPKKIGAPSAGAALAGSLTGMPGGAATAAAATKGIERSVGRIKRGNRQLRNKELVERYVRRYNKKPTILPSL